MNVPFMAHRLIKNGKQFLEIWHDNQRRVVESPIKPYFLSDKKFSIPAEIEKVQGYRKSTGRPGTFYKYIFDTVKGVPQYRRYQCGQCGTVLNNKQKKGIYCPNCKGLVKSLTFEDNIPFVNRVGINCPEFYRQYPHTNPLYNFTYDIEQMAEDGGFPRIEDPIISVALAVDRITDIDDISQGEIKVFMGDEEDICRKIYEYLVRLDESDIQINIMTGYNHIEFDNPRLFYKMDKYGYMDVFENGGQSPRVDISKQYVRLPGIGQFDVGYHTRQDQSLMGEVKDRGLKAVSKHFGLPGYDLPDKDMRKYRGTKKLMKYNASDVYRTRWLFYKYFRVILYIAEEFGMPLESMFEPTARKLTEIIYGRLFREKNIVSDGDNRTIFYDVYNYSKQNGEAAYQGAIVNIRRTGRFKPVRKIDYSSQYPTLAALFNLSPETTHIVKMKKYSGKFKYKQDGDYVYFNIPDKRVLGGRDVVLRINTEESDVARQIFSIMEDRKEVKRELQQFKQKESKTEEDRTKQRDLESHSTSLKVVLNKAYYGALGNGGHPYGYFPVAMATTGLGRRFIRLLWTMEGDYFDVIESDTDGVYIKPYEGVTDEEILEEYEDRVMEKFPHLKTVPELGIDNYVAGYFIKQKNYLLLTKSGDVIKHGNSLKNKKFPSIIDKFVDEVARPVLTGNREKAIQIVRKYLNVEDFPLEDLTRSISLQTPFDKISKKSQSYRLALEATMKLEVKPTVGQRYHYIQIRGGGYTNVELAKESQVDYNYYRDKIKDIAENLGLYPLEQPTGDIGGWL